MRSPTVSDAVLTRGMRARRDTSTCRAVPQYGCAEWLDLEVEDEWGVPSVRISHTSQHKLRVGWLVGQVLWS